MQRVCVFPSLNGGLNPYLRLIKAALENTGVEPVPWSWSLQPEAIQAILLNWPEYLWLPYRGIRTRIRQKVERQKFLTLLQRHRARGSSVIFVAHNSVPHDWSRSPGEWDHRISALWPLVDASIHLTRASAFHPAFRSLKAKPSFVVPHPHYELVDAATHYELAGSIRRIALVGGLHPRKQASRVVEVALQIPNLNIFISGQHQSPALKLDSFDVHRIEMRRYQLSEGELHRIFDGRTALVLNQAAALNSGMMILALSRGAPVIAPRTAVNQELQAEFGPQWLRLFDGDISTQLLQCLLASPVPSELPDLSGRTLSQVGASVMNAVFSSTVTTQFRASRDNWS